MSNQNKERNDRLSNPKDPITAPKPGAGGDDPKGNFGDRAVPVENVITREASEPSGPTTGGAFGSDPEDVVEAVVEGRKVDPTLRTSAPVSVAPPKGGTDGLNVSHTPAKPNFGVAPGEPHLV